MATAEQALAVFAMLHENTERKPDMIRLIGPVRAVGSLKFQKVNAHFNVFKLMWVLVCVHAHMCSCTQLLMCTCPHTYAHMVTHMLLFYGMFFRPSSAQK